MKPTVLFTASTYSHILNFHLPYLQYFQESGWVVHVACGGTASPIPFADKIIHLPFQKKMFAPTNFRAAHILRKQIQKNEYIFISTHTSLAAFFTRLAVMGLSNRPKLANLSHGYLFDHQTQPLKRMFLLGAERCTAAQTDLLLTMNRYDFELARHYSLGKQILSIPGVGVDFSKLEVPLSTSASELRADLQIPEHAFVLFYAAEFSKRKSQSVLLRALIQLPEEAILVLAGEGALLEECKTLAKQLGVAHRVIFPGYIKEIGLWLSIADVVVSSSRSEGLPFNIMEAMYAGVPVVASQVKGHEDLISHGETGLLYPYGDWVACAMQISHLMESKQLCETLSTQAKEYVAQYSLEQVFPSVLNAYESVLPSPIPAHSTSRT